MADLVSEIAQQMQPLASVLERAEEKVRDMRRHHAQASMAMEERLVAQETDRAAQAVALEQQAGRLAEAMHTLGKERQEVGKLRSEMEKLAVKLLESEKGAASAVRDLALHRVAMDLLQEEAHKLRAMLRAKLLRSCRTKALECSFASWLRFIEASRMRSILWESGSTNSTLDNQIRDALSPPPSSIAPPVSASSVTPPPSLAEASSIDL